MGHTVLVHPCVRFDVVPLLRHHFFGQNVLAVKEVLERSLHLVQRPRPLMECGDHGDQHIGVVLNIIEVKVVFIVIVGGIVGVEVVLKLVLQTAIVGLGPQHIRILRLVGAGGHRTHKAVAHRHHRGHTRLHQQKQEHTAQRKERSHGMPLGKGHRLGGQLFRGDCRFFGSLGALLGGFPRPLLILPLQLVLMPHPGGAFSGLGLFLGKLAGVVIRRGLDIPGLGAGGSLGRVLPDGLFHLAFTIVEGSLPGTLDKVTALHAYVVMLLLIDFPMHKGMGLGPGHPACPLHGAGFLGRLLCDQPITGLAQLFLPALHAELGFVELGLFAVLMKLLATVTRSTARSTLSVFHWRRPPAWWSADCKSLLGGNGLQTESSRSHRTAGPHRNWTA